MNLTLFSLCLSFCKKDDKAQKRRAIKHKVIETCNAFHPFTLLLLFKRDTEPFLLFYNHS